MEFILKNTIIELEKRLSNFELIEELYESREMIFNELKIRFNYSRSPDCKYN